MGQYIFPLGNFATQFYHLERVLSFKQLEGEEERGPWMLLLKILRLNLCKCI